MITFVVWAIIVWIIALCLLCICYRAFPKYENAFWHVVAILSMMIVVYTPPCTLGAFIYVTIDNTFFAVAASVVCYFAITSVINLVSNKLEN